MLVSKMKSVVSGQTLNCVYVIENIQQTVTDDLNTLTENDFRYCYDQWKKRNRCVTSQGSYFEGDNL